MKKFILKSSIFSLIFTIFLVSGILFVKAWSGIKATNGDKVTTSKWNELVGHIIKENGAKSISTNGIFCGATDLSYNGAGVGGYDGAKDKCETKCNDPLAHMCTNSEIIYSKSLGITPTAGTWYSNFTRRSEGTTAIHDCQARGSTNSAHGGPYVGNTTNYANRDYCNQTHKIACCK